jgi:hypothetical protein
MGPRPASRPYWPKDSAAVVASLKRLGVILLTWDFQR